MAQMTMIEAIRDAHEIAMTEDDNVIVFGEDVGFLAVYFAVLLAFKRNLENRVALIPQSMKVVLLARR